MANKFWVGGGSTTNWSATANTNWSDTDGGAGNAAVPVAGDSVFFNGNSGTGASVWNTSISLVTLNCTLSKNVITHSNAIVITLSSGNLVLPTGVGGTYAAATVTAGFTFTGTAGTQQITTNGFAPGTFVFNGVGGTFQLQDNLTTLAAINGIINLSAGTFDNQSFTVSTPIFSAASAVFARAMVGSGAYTVGTANQTGTLWAISAGGTLTITSFTGNIIVTGTTAATRNIQFSGNSITWLGQLIVGANTDGGSLQILSSNIFNGLQVTGPNLIALTATTTTLSVAPTITGTPGNEVFIVSNVLDTARTLSIASGTASLSWCAIRDITCSGGATFIATNSFDGGHNSGITITPPSGASSFSVAVF